MRILIIEDEYELADIIKSKLKKEKFMVDISTDGYEGLCDALSNVYDLILLDVMLPNVNGFEILKKIRDNNIQSKIIMITAKSLLEDKLNGFNNGADDYLTKPFHIDELIARINVQLKNRKLYESKDILKFCDLELNSKTLKLICTKTNENVELVCKEYQLLEYFINNAGIILSKEQIYDKVWGIYTEIESNNLEVYLSFIRKKIKAIGSSVLIKSARGIGYKLEISNE